MIYPTDLTDSQWQAIKLLLPLKIWQRKRKYSIRTIINAILYVVKGGIQWRMMPHDLPKWETVYYHHNLWSKTGVWKAMNAALVKIERERKGRKAQPSAAVGDSQSVKTTQKKGIAAGTATRRSRAASAT